MNKDTEKRLWHELHELRHQVQVVTQAVAVITHQLEEIKDREKEAREKADKKMSKIMWAVGLAVPTIISILALILK